MSMIMLRIRRPQIQRPFRFPFKMGRSQATVWLVVAYAALLLGCAVVALAMG